jgi:hypothetical protein
LHRTNVVDVERLADLVRHAPMRVEVTIPAHGIAERREVVDAEHKEFHQQLLVVDPARERQDLVDQRDAFLEVFG